jgi:hypothetical protein
LNLFPEVRDWTEDSRERRGRQFRVLMNQGVQDVMSTLIGHPQLECAALRSLGIRLYPFNANRNAAADLFSDLLVPDTTSWIPLRESDPALRVFILGYGHNGVAFLELLLQPGHPFLRSAKPKPRRLEICIIDKNFPRPRRIRNTPWE